MSQTLDTRASPAVPGSKNQCIERTRASDESGTKTTTYSKPLKPPPRSRGGGVGGSVSKGLGRTGRQSITNKSSSTLASLQLPGGSDLLEKLRTVARTEEQFGGLCMVLSIMWEGRFHDAKTMRLPKVMALCFLSDTLCRPWTNPATVVAEATGCRLLERASNTYGNVTNIWSYPAGADGSTVAEEVKLMPSQLKRWERRHEILRECQEEANPAVRLIRDTLSRTTESDRFKELAAALTAKGKMRAVNAWRKSPTKVTVTRDGDILHSVARLPPMLRQKLLIDEKPIIELDVKSAHPVLLGIVYKGKSSAEWLAERDRYLAEAARGFPTLYGEGKDHKKAFLAALNQTPNAARHASRTYAALEKQFPLLAREIEWKREERPKALGAMLRSALAKIMSQAVVDNSASGHLSLPVTDSIMLVLSGNDDSRAIAECVGRMSVALHKLTGITPLICSSDGRSPLSDLQSTE